MKDFKPILGILLRFVVIYIVLLLCYQFYLNQSVAGGLDPFSRWTARQVQVLQNALGFKTQFYDDIPNLQVYFYVVKEYTSRMVEGCNGISVMILFLAFIFAFYKGAKTFVFALVGLVFIHVMNVLRIAALNIVIYEYDAYADAFHDYVFPSIIYGSVVLLWLIWIKFFALKK
jgi:exosortase family protein XrtF